MLTILVLAYRTAAIVISLNIVVDSLSNNIIMFNLRRKEIPWEVVDSEIVEPIPVYYDEEGLWNSRTI